MIVIDRILGIPLDHSHIREFDPRYVNVTGDIMSGDLVPKTDSDIDLGSPSKYWANIYADKLYLGSAALLETPIAGAIEYANSRFYVTNLAVQRALDRTSDVALETVTVANTTTEIVIWTGDMPANSLVAGNVFRFLANGIVSSESAADLVTVRIKVNGVTKATLESEAKQLDDDSWHLDAVATQRTIGATGSRAIHIHLVVDEYETIVTGVAEIDTTASMDVTITAQWNNAKAGNSISLFQGFMGYRN